MKKIIKTIVAVLSLALVLGIASTTASAVSTKWPSLSTSAYAESYCRSTGNDTPVYTSSSLSTRGTSSPYQAYNATIYASDVIRIFTALLSLLQNVIANQNAAKFYRPITGTDAGYAGDSGLDIATPKGTPVYAIADGTIEYSQWGKTPWTTPPDTPYSVNYKLDTPITHNGKTIRYVFYTHMSQLIYSKQDGSSTVIVSHNNNRTK